MLDWIFIMMAVMIGAAGGGGERTIGTVTTGSATVSATDDAADSATDDAADSATDDAADSATDSATDSGTVAVGGDVVIGGNVTLDLGADLAVAETEDADVTDLLAGVIPADPVDSAATDAPAFEAEPQTPSGKFTTATEVKPILGMTKANWVAISEYDGQDLLYATHLLSWRCGMHQIRYAINDGPMQVWPMPPCLTDTAQPNAIRTEDGLPFERFPLGSIQSISVELLFDDLSEDSATFQRSDVLMP